MPLASPRPGGAGRDALVVLGSLLVLGLLGGVLWWLVVDPAQFTKTAQGGAMAENELGKRFDADAWFVVIGLVAGLAAGVVLSLWRSRDELLTSGLLVLGSLLAGGAMLLVGHLVGPHGTEAALRAARVGAKVPESLGVDTALTLLGWPVGVLAGSLLVLLGRAPEDPRHDGGPATTGAVAAPSEG